MSDVNTGEGTESSVTEDDVLESRQEVDALRLELAEIQQQTAALESGRTQAVRKAALDREAAILRAQVEQARESLEVAEGDHGPMATFGDNDTATGVDGVFVGSNDQPEVNQETGEVEADQVRAFTAAAMGEDYEPRTTDTDSDGSSLVDATDGDQ